MIILAFSVAAMLVVGSYVGRLLARAREEWSVEFRTPEFELAQLRTAPGREHWGLRLSGTRGARVAGVH